MSNASDAGSIGLDTAGIGASLATGNYAGAVVGGLALAGFIYHRWFDNPTPPPPARSMSFPRTDVGSPYALLYGRCRVRSPVLAWTNTPIPFFISAGDGIPPLITAPSDSYYYFADLFFVLGIPFDNGDQHLINVYQGDVKMAGESNLTPLDGLGDDGEGPGNFEDVRQLALTGNTCSIELDTIAGSGGQDTFGMVEFLNGNDNQRLVDPGNGALTRAGQYMTLTTTGHPAWGNLNGILDPNLIPGYRGFLSVFLFSQTPTTDPSNPILAHWLVGTSPSVPTYSFECASYPTTLTSLSATKVGVEANPTDVILDLLTGRSKLGIPASRIDALSFEADSGEFSTSFGQAAETLAVEGHGFSRSWENGADAATILKEVLAQIDATLYEDFKTGLIKIKLIRNDYNPLTIPQITRANCDELTNFSAGGWTNLPSKVRVTFTNRGDGYRDGSGVAQNTPTAAIQDGETPELQISMPGICTQELADNIAGRELAAQCRPVMKFTAICDRSLIGLNPGDPVRVYWTNPTIAGLVFRVASPNRGTLKNGKVAIDLIQDYFYTYRSRTPVVHSSGFPGPPAGIHG